MSIVSSIRDYINSVFKSLLPKRDGFFWPGLYFGF